MIGYLIIILLHLNIDHLNHQMLLFLMGNNNFYYLFQLKWLYLLYQNQLYVNTSASQFWINSVISCLELLLKEYDFFSLS